MTHVSGPWELDEDGAVWAPEWTVDGGDCICDPPAEGMEESRGHWADNSRLICAAPMLLEGAIDAVEALKLLRIGAASQMPDALAVIDAHIDELSYAIASATSAEVRSLGREGE